MKKLILSLFLLTGITFAFAQINPNEELPLDPTVRKGTLANGMTYYIKHNEKPENKVELRLAVNAGSILEDDDQLGLAHFMEHMNFNGTKNFPDNELVDFLQSIGIKFGQHLNAYTSFDETVYMLPVPLDKPGNLDSALLVMEDWAFNALLTDEQIEKERGVVLEEMRTGLGPDKRMLDGYLPKLMNGSKYADRLPIGTKESIENFDPDALRRFHKDWYRPDLMALIVVGDVNVDEIEEKIKKDFGKYKAPENPRERETFDMPNNEEPIVAIESDPDATFSQVRMYIKDKGNYVPDPTLKGYLKDLTFRLTTGMINNRIRELVDSNDPPFTFGSVYYGSTLARNKYGLQGFAVTKEGEQLKGLEVIFEELERAKKYGFSEGELERVRKEYLSRLEKAYNDRDKTESGRIVGQYIRNFLEEEPIPGIEWEYETTKKVISFIPLEALNQVVKNLIFEDNRAYIITGPEKESITQPTEKEVLAVIEEVGNRDIQPYEQGEQMEALISTLPQAGSITSETIDEETNTKTLTLSNGVKVTYKVTDFKDDEILFRATSKGGTSVLDNEDYNNTKWAYSMLSNAGVNGYNKSQLNQYLSDKVVNVSMGIYNTTESMSGNSSKKDLKIMFELIHSYFTGLNFDQEAYDAEIEKQNAFMGNMLSQPNFFFSSEIQKYRNSENPRFTGIIPFEEDWKNTDFKAAYDVYKAKFSDADDFHFFFVGNIDEAQFKSYLETYIASLPSTKDEENWVDHGYRPKYESVEKVVNKGKDPKSMVQIQFSGETTYSAEEDLAMEALGKILTINLIEQLREEEGGVYGAGASGGLGKYPYGSYYLSIRFPCGPENVDKLVASSLEQLDQIIQNGPTEKDLAKYKEGELNDYRDNMKKNNFWLSQLNSAFIYDEGNKFLDFEERINELTAEDVQKVAKKYATDNRMIATLFPEEE